MKGKVLVIYETGEQEFVDIHFDENNIDGHYTTKENIEDMSVNVILRGSTLTLKRKSILMSFLNNKFGTGL